MSLLGFVTLAVLIIVFATTYRLDRKNHNAAQSCRFVLCAGASLLGICLIFMGPPSEFISGMALLMLATIFIALTLFRQEHFNKKIAWVLAICTIIVNALAIFAIIRLLF